MTGIHTEPSLCVKVFLTQGPLARKGYLYSIESKRVGRIPLRAPARKNAHRSHFSEFDEYCYLMKTAHPDEPHSGGATLATSQTAREAGISGFFVLGLQS